MQFLTVVQNFVFNIYEPGSITPVIACCVALFSGLLVNQLICNYDNWKAPEFLYP
jgi:hypothetical protein